MSKCKLKLTLSENDETEMIIPLIFWLDTTSYFENASLSKSFQERYHSRHISAVFMQIEHK
jgi:hypothetical protein